MQLLSLIMYVLSHQVSYQCHINGYARCVQCKSTCNSFVVCRASCPKHSLHFVTLHEASNWFWTARKNGKSALSKQSVAEGNMQCDQVILQGAKLHETSYTVKIAFYRTGLITVYSCIETHIHVVLFCGGDMNTCLFCSLWKVWLSSSQGLGQT